MDARARVLSIRAFLCDTKIGRAVNASQLCCPLAIVARCEKFAAIAAAAATHLTHSIISCRDNNNNVKPFHRPGKTCRRRRRLLRAPTATGARVDNCALLVFFT